LERDVKDSEGEIDDGDDDDNDDDDDVDDDDDDKDEDDGGNDEGEKRRSRAGIGEAHSPSFAGDGTRESVGLGLYAYL
jgi:hypothetical protein